MPREPVRQLPEYSYRSRDGLCQCFVTRLPFQIMSIGTEYHSYDFYTHEKDKPSNGISPITVQRENRSCHRQEDDSRHKNVQSSVESGGGERRREILAIVTSVGFIPVMFFDFGRFKEKGESVEGWLHEVADA